MSCCDRFTIPIIPSFTGITRPHKMSIASVPVKWTKKKTNIWFHTKKVLCIKRQYSTTVHVLSHNEYCTVKIFGQGTVPRLAFFPPFLHIFLPVQVLEVKELWNCYITKCQTVHLKKCASLVSNLCKIVCQIKARVYN